MATPFAEFASLRMAWHRPIAAISSLREGIRPNTEIVCIEAYIDDIQGPSTEEQLGGKSIGQASMNGFITRWAVVPSGGNWLDSGSNWFWNDSGLRPNLFPRGEKLEVFVGDLSNLPNLSGGEKGWLTINTLSSVGGIDALVRAEAGDEFTGLFVSGR